MKPGGTTSHESLVEDVKGALIRNEAQQGDAMTEAILCRRLKVSRGAIRDALAQLESQGLIERKKKKGTRKASTNVVAALAAKYQAGAGLG